MNHNFGEKEVEIIKGKELPVWQTPKYLKSKEKAIEMIESGKYNLDDGDFWILQNTYANGTKVMYSGLIISHNGCLKINDSIENKFKPECFHVEPNQYGGLIGVYQDADTFEFGEVSEKNCRNDYPYAMVLKRTMDRVILKKSKLAFYGVYSDSESDEFKEKFDDDEPKQTPKQVQNKRDLKFATDEQIAIIRKMYDEQNFRKLLDAHNIVSIDKLPFDVASSIVQKLKERYGNELV